MKCQHKSHFHVAGEMFQGNQRSETRKSSLRPQGLTLQRTRSFTVCCLMRTRKMESHGLCSVFNSQVDCNSKYHHCAVAFCFSELMLKQTEFPREGRDTYHRRTKESKMVRWVVPWVKAIGWSTEAWCTFLRIHC